MLLALLRVYPSRCSRKAGAPLWRVFPPAARGRLRSRCRASPLSNRLPSVIRLPSVTAAPLLRLKGVCSHAARCVSPPAARQRARPPAARLDVVAEVSVGAQRRHVVWLQLQRLPPQVLRVPPRPHITMRAPVAWRRAVCEGAESRAVATPGAKCQIQLSCVRLMLSLPVAPEPRLSHTPAPDKVNRQPTLAQ